MRRALADAAATGDAERAWVARQLRLGRQRARAAEALFATGARAEALRLAIGAFEAAEAARSEPISNARIAAARRALAELDPPPAVDAEVTAAHDRRYEALLRGHRALDRALAPTAMTPADVRRRRAVRWVGLAAALLAALVAIGWAARTPRRTMAAASDYDGRRHEHQPYFAFDGDPSTEWWLRDRRAGWVEARIDPPVDISRVTVTPGHGGDEARSIRDYRVELWRGNERLASEAGTVEAVHEDPAPTNHALSAERVDRVRVVVDSWHGAGGAIADVQWD